jgi:hypothetical protein
VDPLQGRVFRVPQVPPGTALTNEFCLVEPVDARRYSGLLLTRSMELVSPITPDAL